MDITTKYEDSDALGELVSVCLLDWSLVKKPCDTWQGNAAFCQGLETGLGLQIEREQGLHRQDVNHEMEQPSDDDDDFVDLLQDLQFAAAQSAAAQSEDMMSMDLDEEHLSLSDEDLQTTHITSTTNTVTLPTQPIYFDEYKHRWTGM